jgi:hypothetical protein
MPTPFMHLQLAERVLAHERLDENVRTLLYDHYPAFYLGNVAADFQTICDIPRENTHFYDLPPARDARAYPEMLVRYPQLAQVDGLPGDQAVFIAAYCTHLMLDLRWYHEVLIPYFVAPSGWPSHRQRFIIHNTLLTYLDKLAVESLPAAAGEILAAARPCHWLPFARDEDLIDWQEMLVAQLAPGALLQTVAIYAGRLSMSPKEFAANLADPEWMIDHVFQKAPLEAVQGMLTSAVSESVGLITDYLNGGLASHS